MFMYITTFGRSLDVLGTLLNNLAQSSTDAALEAMHTRMYAGFGGGRIENLIRVLRTSCFAQRS